MKNDFVRVKPYETAGELFFDFSHNNPKSYKRVLDLQNGILNVDYINDGVEFKREYFASYIDNCIVGKFSTNQKDKSYLRLRLPTWKSWDLMMCCGLICLSLPVRRKGL